MLPRRIPFLFPPNADLDELAREVFVYSWEVCTIGSGQQLAQLDYCRRSYSLGVRSMSLDLSKCVLWCSFARQIPQA